MVMMALPNARKSSHRGSSSEVDRHSISGVDEAISTQSCQTLEWFRYLGIDVVVVKVAKAVQWMK